MKVWALLVPKFKTPPVLSIFFTFFGRGTIFMSLSNIVRTWNRESAVAYLSSRYTVCYPGLTAKMREIELKLSGKLPYINTKATTVFNRTLIRQYGGYVGYKVMIISTVQKSFGSKIMFCFWKFAWVSHSVFELESSNFQKRRLLKC